MRSYLGDFAQGCLAFFGGRGPGVMVLLLAVVGVGGLAGGAPEVEAQEYSAYLDPEKTAISVVLSDRGNVEEFQSEFGLSDEEVETVLATIRAENEALAQTRDESQRIIESNKELPVEQVRGKVAASGYDEKVKETVAQTKSEVQRALPAERQAELQAWVDDKWQQERRRAQERRAANRAAAAAGKAFEVYATQYNGYTRYEVALPNQSLKFAGGYRVLLSLNGTRASAPVKEVGPWNINDNWWDKRKFREMWKDLPRGVPEAEAAYYDNYNRGRDEFGRKVLNPAGVDLTPAVADKLGLRKYENAWILVSYPK